MTLGQPPRKSHFVIDTKQGQFSQMTMKSTDHSNNHSRFGSQLSWRVAFWSLLACVTVALCFAIADFRNERKEFEKNTYSSLKTTAALFKPLLLQSLLREDDEALQQLVASISISPNVTYVNLSMDDGRHIRFGSLPVDNRGHSVEENLTYDKQGAPSNISSLVLMHDFSRDNVQDILFEAFIKYLLFSFCVWLAIYTLYRYFVLLRILSIRQHIGPLSTLEETLKHNERIFDDIIPKTIIDDIDELVYVMHRLWKMAHTGINTQNQTDTPVPSEKVAELTHELIEKDHQLRVHTAIINTLPYKVFWKDTNLNIIGANQSFLDERGIDCVENLQGPHDEEMLWGKQAGLHHADDRYILESRQAQYGYEEVIPTKQGGEITVVTIKAPLIDADGQVLGLVSLYQEKQDQIT